MGRKPEMADQAVFKLNLEEDRFIIAHAAHTRPKAFICFLLFEIEQEDEWTSTQWRGGELQAGEMLTFSEIT